MFNIGQNMYNIVLYLSTAAKTTSVQTLKLEINNLPMIPKG
jgi:hypothetical protein